MEQKTSTVDLARWAQITIERWKIKIGKIGFGPKSTGAFIRSLSFFPKFVNREAQGDKAKITFAFLFYGYYWDEGVGRGYSRGNSGDIGQTAKRKKHRWFNKVYWREVETLKRLLAKEYGEEYINELVQSIESIKL